MTSVYPYLRGRFSRGLELWAVGGYGRGAAADARGDEPFGDPGELTMTMTAAGLRQEVAEGSGVALSVVGGRRLVVAVVGGRRADGGGPGGEGAPGPPGLEASRASGGFSVRSVRGALGRGRRPDGGGCGTGRGAAGVGGAARPGGAGPLAVGAFGGGLRRIRGAGPPGLPVAAGRDGSAGGAGPALGRGRRAVARGDGLLGGAGAEGPHRGASWTPEARALSVDGEVGYGWRSRRPRGVLSPTAGWRRAGFGGGVTRAGLSWLSSEDSRRDVRMQLTVGRERWRERRAGYQLAVALTSIF